MQSALDQAAIALSNAVFDYNKDAKVQSLDKRLVGIQ
jgi:hypothetical protein